MKELVLAGYSNGEKKFFTQRFTEEGKLIYGEMTSQNWNNEYPILFPLKKDHQNYLVGHNKNGTIFIQRILSDGTLFYKESVSYKLGGFSPNLFLFEMEGAHFLAGQTEEDNKFFIKKINPEVSGIEDYLEDSWDNFYQVINVVSIDGKYLLYSHNLSNNRFCTQFINENKTLSKEIYDKKWERPYSIIRHFSYGSQNYLYGHSKKNNRFFIAPILTDGGLGKEAKSSKKWERFYKKLNHCWVGEKLFLYGQSETDNRFFISRIKDGELEGESFDEDKSHFYDTQGTIEIRGKVFFYGLSKDSDKKFIVQEIKENGKLGKHIVSNPSKNDNWLHFYDFLIPFYDETFFFGQDWMGSLSGDLKLKDVCMPGTHDAGMYKIHESIRGKMEKVGIFLNINNYITNSEKFDVVEKVEDFVLTQELSIGGQLARGVRYFDLRVKFFDKINLYVNGIEIDDICLVHGLPGPSFNEVLSDIKSFMESGSKETLTLMFTHFKNFKKSTQDFINRIEKYLGDYLLKKEDVNDYFSANPEMKKTISNLPLSMLRGKIIIGIESEVVTPRHIRKQIEKLNKDEKEAKEKLLELENEIEREIEDDIKNGVIAAAQKEEEKKLRKWLKVGRKTWMEWNSQFDFNLLEGKNFYWGYPYQVQDKYALVDYPLNMPELEIEKHFPNYHLDLKYEDHYADQEEYKLMRDDQLKKFKYFGTNIDAYSGHTIGLNGVEPGLQKRIINEESLFSLDWTLTFSDKNPKNAEKEGVDLLLNYLKNPDEFQQLPSDTMGKFLFWSNKKKAREVNEKLINLDDQGKVILSPNEQGRKVNIISVDYVPGEIARLCWEITKAK